MIQLSRVFMWRLPKFDTWSVSSGCFACGSESSGVVGRRQSWPQNRARVRKTRQPVTVTRFGTPVAEIVPPSPPPRTEGRLGCMKDTAELTGDLVLPLGDAEDWDVLRP
ncbi:MAG: hypothetical protein M8843_08420 [marine benthic group bacterium]|nr:hypothetical protein [Gemmatimonadota bacterium]MCL7977786.1 hypothetical protein [Gemmatimonadota bacterium]MCL7979094.1 hypothetical protein [Gemmatimonadota bacterium]